MPEERWLTFTPKEIRAVATTDTRSVLLMLDLSDPELGLAPGLKVAVELPPDRARDLARVLLSKADEAEAELPRA